MGYNLRLQKKGSAVLANSPKLPDEPIVTSLIYVYNWIHFLVTFLENIVYKLIL